MKVANQSHTKSGNPMNIVEDEIDYSHVELFLCTARHVTQQAIETGEKINNEDSYSFFSGISWAGVDNIVHHWFLKNKERLLSAEQRHSLLFIHYDKKKSLSATIFEVSNFKNTKINVSIRRFFENKNQLYPDALVKIKSNISAFLNEHFKDLFTITEIFNEIFTSSHSLLTKIHLPIDHCQVMANLVRYCINKNLPELSREELKEKYIAPVNMFIEMHPKRTKLKNASQIFNFLDNSSKKNVTYHSSDSDDSSSPFDFF